MNRPNLFALLCVLMLAWLPVSAQEYSNPVKPGSHPGSSVCRAGDKWVHLQNSIPDNYLCNDTMAVGKKYLMRLYPHGSLTENQLPTFAGRLQECASFTLETEVVTKGNVEAGLSVYRVSDGHFDFFVSKKQVALRCKLKSIDYVVKSVLFARWKAIPRVGFHELLPDWHRGGRRLCGHYAGHVCRGKAKERSC